MAPELHSLVSRNTPRSINTYCLTHIQQIMFVNSLINTKHEFTANSDFKIKSKQITLCSLYKLLH